MCGRTEGCGTAEDRAVRVGMRIRECAGLTRGAVFSAGGGAATIYLPAGWTGPIRDAEIVKQVEILAGRVFGEDDVTEVWRRIAVAARAGTAQRFYGMLTVPVGVSDAAD